MNKTNFNILICLIMFSPTLLFAQTPQKRITDTLYTHANGGMDHVKDTIERYITRTKEGNSIEGKDEKYIDGKYFTELDWVQTFDKFGNVIVMTRNYHDIDGEIILSGKSIFEYNSLGLEIKRTYQEKINNIWQNVSMNLYSYKGKKEISDVEMQWDGDRGKWVLKNNNTTDNNKLEEYITISAILATATETSCKTQDIFNLNVLEYYELYNHYDTQLKRKLFKETPEYQNYLNELKKLKGEMLESTYYSKFENLFNEKDYDIERQGFEIEIHQNQCCFVQLNGFPSKQLPEKFIADGFLFIPVNETKGLEIEENRSDIDVYFLYTPSGIVTEYNNITTNKVRVVVANRTSGKRYFDKNYTCTPHPTKK